MDSKPPAIDGSPTRMQRMRGFFLFGAWFGSVAGTVTGTVFARIAGFDLIEAIQGSLFGGVTGASLAILIVGALGGRKAMRVDQMHTACFSGAFGTIVGGMIGIGALNLLSFTVGRSAGDFSRIAEDLFIILLPAAAIGSIATWLVSLVTNEKKLQWILLALFLASVVAVIFITPSALAFGVGGAIAGFFSQRMLIEGGAGRATQD